jgi:hypothetical protein
MQLRIQVLVLLLQGFARELLFGEQVREDVPLFGDSLHHFGNLEGFAHCHLQLVVVFPQFSLHLLQVVHFFLEVGYFGVALLLKLEQLSFLHLTHTFFPGVESKELHLP